jgi:xylono-1,5-lactonase
VELVSAPECVWPVEALLGEGPLWQADEGVVWFVDIKGDRLHRFDPETGSGETWTTPTAPGFVARRKSGGFVIGTKAGLQDFDPADGSFSPRLAVEPQHPGNRLNDGYVDARGRLWFGSMDDAGRAPTGSLYRYDRNGLGKADSGIRITNGPATSPDGWTLYHTDTLGRTIHAFDLGDNGALSNKRLFATIERGYPDGMAVDVEGHVWCALYGGWGIDRFAPSGEKIAHIAFPCSNITKPAFGGHDLRTLYVTTARQELTAAQLAEQPLAGGLFALAVDTPGLPTNSFDG